MKRLLDKAVNEHGYVLPNVRCPSENTRYRLGRIKKTDRKVIQVAEKSKTDLEFTCNVMEARYQNNITHDYMNFFHSDNKLYWMDLATSVYTTARQRIYLTDSDR